MLVDNRFYVVGRCDKSKIDRMSMDELLQNVDNDKYIVVLDENRLKHDLKADEIRLNTNKEENVHGE